MPLSYQLIFCYKPVCRTLHVCRRHLQFQCVHIKAWRMDSCWVRFTYSAMAVVWIWNFECISWMLHHSHLPIGLRDRSKNHFGFVRGRAQKKNGSVLRIIFGQLSSTCSFFFFFWWLHVNCSVWCPEMYPIISSLSQKFWLVDSLSAFVPADGSQTHSCQYFFVQCCFCLGEWRGHL